MVAEENESSTIKNIVTSTINGDDGTSTNNTSVLDIAADDLTPGMKQYQEVKRAHPDCLVMLRMGDFFEMFYEDAIAASRELEITLTARGKGDKRAPLAGIPYHALDPYLAKLVKKGYKVALVEQLEDPKLVKGLIKRGLVRIVTPGTVIESSILKEKENNYILSLTAYGDEFSLALCDMSTGEFLTTTLKSISALWSEIARFNPSEVIIPESLKVNKELMDKLKVNSCFINSVEDYYFSGEKARQILLQHFNLQRLDAFGLEDHPRNIAVSGSLLQYMLSTQKNSLSHIKRISIQSNRQSMLLDSSTIRNLELIQNIRDGTSRGALLSVLDQTVTSMGSRLLKKWIKNPLLSIKLIQERLDAIHNLNQKVIEREEIKELLEKVFDLERLISRVNYGNATPRELLSLKVSLQQLPSLKIKLSGKSKIEDTITEHKVTLLKNISQISGMEEPAELLSQAIRDDAPITIRDGGIIKPGFNQELDQLCSIQHNSKKYLQELEEREKQKTGISTLRISYTNVFGYFIEVTRKNTHLVPATYIRKQTTANSERYITEELKIEEEKILGAEEKSKELEYKLFQEIIKTLATKTEEIQDIAAKLAVLDVLCSLASISMENGYTMPEFVEQKVLQIKNGRHPVIEKLESRFVPNDIFMNGGEMMIITGPNMAGKSTVMRQTALIVLMAQIGCFVPADKVVLGIADRIFTRVGAYDDLSSGQSTFMVEMSESAAILNNATQNSLIILDEIGRGTSTFDGVSIAWSVAEHIHNTIKARTLFATHYHVMNKLAEKFARIKNYNIAVREVKGEVIFLHKLVEGGTDESYGIHVAKLAGLPDEVVQRAKEIQEILQKDDDMMRKMKAKKLEEQTRLEGF